MLLCYYRCLMLCTTSAKSCSLYLCFSYFVSLHCDCSPPCDGEAKHAKHVCCCTAEAPGSPSKQPPSPSKQGGAFGGLFGASKGSGGSGGAGAGASAWLPSWAGGAKKPEEKVGIANDAHFSSGNFALLMSDYVALQNRTQCEIAHKAPLSTQGHHEWHS